MAATRGKRGPYKRYLRDSIHRIPRQTLCNWRKRDFCRIADACLDQCLQQPMDQPSKAEQPIPTSEESKDGAPGPALDMSDDEDECEPSPTLDMSEWSPTPVNDDEACITHTVLGEESPPQHLLYPGTRITQATGTLLLHTLMRKHGLTHNGLADTYIAACMFTHASRQYTSSFQICTPTILCLQPNVKYTCGAQSGSRRDIWDGSAYSALTSPGEFLSAPTNS